jgi:hypothetical protein
LAKAKADSSKPWLIACKTSAPLRPYNSCRRSPSWVLRSHPARRNASRRRSAPPDRQLPENLPLPPEHTRYRARPNPRACKPQHTAGTGEITRDDKRCPQVSTKPAQEPPTTTSTTRRAPPDLALCGNYTAMAGSASKICAAVS